MNRRLLSDLAGLSVVAIATLLAAGVIGTFIGNAKDIVMIAVLGLIGAALCTWYLSKTGQKNDAKTWMKLTIATPIVGAVSFTIDMFGESTLGHYSNLVQAGLHAGGPFGIMATVLICPIGTIICAGSWVRASLLDYFFPKSSEQN